MATKKSSAAGPTDPAPTKKAALTQGRRQTLVALGANSNAGAVVLEFSKRTFGDGDINELLKELNERMDTMLDGNMSAPQAMLFAQAHALQSIFSAMSRRALVQQDRQAFEAYLRMGLKAQNQCRMTLETLATIKNPPVVFARQANINNGGQQQINNSASTGAPRAPAANPQTRRIEQLEASDGQRLDTRATGTAGGVDPVLATLGSVDRPTHR